MESIAVLRIKLSGIIGCIDEYTSDPPIKAIIDGLNAALLESDFKMILFTCEEIDKWYKKNIGNILGNDFVFNKDSHMQNITELKHIIVDLKENFPKCTDNLPYLAEKAPTTGSNITLSEVNIMKKKYQVFLSSTYTDLIEERMAVIRVLLDNDCIPVGMEQFPASDMSQMEYITKILDDCDYYILILAGRYGSIDCDGKGFTEKEYDYAISKKIPIMSFIMSDIGKLTTEKCEQSDEGRKKLDTFRDRALSNKMAKKYSDIGDLKADIATSINHCIKDYPSVGWVRSSRGLPAKDLSIKAEMLGLSATTTVYVHEGTFGSFTFDYSNNNGEFTIGKDEYAFTTKWSKASDTSIHAYKDGLGGGDIARVKGPVDLQSELSGEFDFSSRTRMAVVGDIIIWKNSYNHYAATKITGIKDDTRGAKNDELTCEFVIYA